MKYPLTPLETCFVSDPNITISVCIQHKVIIRIFPANMYSVAYESCWAQVSTFFNRIAHLLFILGVLMLILLYCRFHLHSIFLWFSFVTIVAYMYRSFCQVRLHFSLLWNSLTRVNSSEFISVFSTCFAYTSVKWYNNTWQRALK